MLKLKHAQTGVSIIELAVVVGIVGLLSALATPSFLGWIQNAQVRTTAESIQAGLQMARTEALRRNVLVRFQFTSSLDASCALSTTGNNWVVSRADPVGACDSAASETASPFIIQSRSSAEGGTNATVAAGQSAIIFNGLGRVSPQPTGNITINISNTTAGVCAASGGTVRCLRVVVSPWGQIRLCDPKLTTDNPNDPQAC